MCTTNIIWRRSQRTEFVKNCVEGLYQKLSGKYRKTSEVIHFNNFELRDRELYHKGMSKPLTTKDGILRAAGEIERILGKKRLHALGFDMSVDKVTAWQAVKLPSVSDVARQMT